MRSELRRTLESSSFALASLFLSFSSPTANTPPLALPPRLLYRTSTSTVKSPRPPLLRPLLSSNLRSDHITLSQPRSRLVSSL